MLNTLLVGLVIVGTIWARDISTIPYSEKKFELGPGFPKALGYTGQAENSRGYIDLVSIYKEQCIECVGRKATMYAVPGACNMYITCVDYGEKVLMYANSCGMESFFDERQSTCVSHDYKMHDQDEYLCERVGNPCKMGNRIPVHRDSCNEYMVCENDKFTVTKCPLGKGFNLLDRDCTNTCPVQEQEVRFVNKTCFAAEDDDHMMVDVWEEKIINGRATLQKADTTRIQCASGLKHLQKSNCTCEQVANECEDVTSVHLFSSDDTWNKARNNKPVGKTSSINGNGTVTNSTSNFPGSAFFEIRNTFLAPGVIGNDLGSRFSFKFNFLAMRIVQGQFVPGMPTPNDEFQHNDYALADNSICGIDPTYGCKLTVVRDNRGRVNCYVKPQNLTDAHVETESGELDLTKRIFVYFAKDNTTGVLNVREEGGAEQSTDIVFPPVRAGGNACPLTIASGTKKRYFRGFMDDMELIKHCDPFLQRRIIT